MKTKTKAITLTGHQKELLKKMLSGSRLIKTDKGRWTLGDTAVRNVTVESLLAKGAIKLCVGHCVPTAAGAGAVGCMTLDEAIRTVADEAPDKFARSYAESAMQAADDGGVQALRSQVRYILANMRNWRGNRARAARKAMKTWLATR